MRFRVIRNIKCRYDYKAKAGINLYFYSYVQHRIKEHEDLVWDLLQQKNTYVFVAGNSKMMPDQVKEALVEVCVGSGNMCKEDAERFLEEMEKKKKYQVECWS